MNLVQRLHVYFQASSPGANIEIIPYAPVDAAHTGLVPATSDIQVSGRTPILACTAQTFRPAPALPGLKFVIVSSLSPRPDVQEAYDTNAFGFDPMAAPASAAKLEVFRAQLTTSRAFTAKLNSQPVAAGMFNSPVEGITELVGITTLEAFRRRGIARLLPAKWSERRLSIKLTL